MSKIFLLPIEVLKFPIFLHFSTNDVSHISRILVITFLFNSGKYFKINQILAHI